MIDIENDDYILILDTYSKRIHRINEGLNILINIVFEHRLTIRGENSYIYFKSRNDYTLWKLKYNITRYIYEHQNDYLKDDYNKRWWIV